MLCSKKKASLEILFCVWCVWNSECIPGYVRREHSWWCAGTLCGAKDQNYVCFMQASTLLLSYHSSSRSPFVKDFKVILVLESGKILLSEVLFEKEERARKVQGLCLCQSGKWKCGKYLQFSFVEFLFCLWMIISIFTFHYMKGGFMLLSGISWKKKEVSYKKMNRCICSIHLHRCIYMFCSSMIFNSIIS